MTIETNQGPSLSLIRKTNQGPSLPLIRKYARTNMVRFRFCNSGTLFGIVGNRFYSSLSNHIYGYWERLRSIKDSVRWKDLYPGSIYASMGKQLFGYAILIMLFMLLFLCLPFLLIGIDFNLVLMKLQSILVRKSLGCLFWQLGWEGLFVLIFISLLSGSAEVAAITMPMNPAEEASSSGNKEKMFQWEELFDWEKTKKKMMRIIRQEQDSIFYFFFIGVLNYGVYPFLYRVWKNLWACR